MKIKKNCERYGFEISTSGKSKMIFYLYSIGKEANSNKKLIRISKLRQLSTIWPLTQIFILD